MKKIFAIMMLAMLALVTVSCDGDEPIPIGNDSVTGQWIPKSAATPGLIIEGNTIEYIVLGSDGTYTEHLIDSEGNTSTQSAAYAVYDNGYIVMSIGNDLYRKVKYQVDAGKTSLTLEGREFRISTQN